MKQDRKRRALLVLWGCLAVLALCVAGVMYLLLQKPEPQNVTIPGVRGILRHRADAQQAEPQRGRTVGGIVPRVYGQPGRRYPFAGLADDLADQGIASVRLDFPGCGESTEPYTAYTLSNMADDVEAAITYMQKEYDTDGPKALVGHSMGGRLASLYPQMKGGGISALVLWSPANGTGLQGLDFLNIDDFSQVEAVAAEAEANGKAGTKWGVEISDVFVQEMRDSDPNAALREAGVPVLLTYAGHETLFTETTVSETIATVQSLPDSQVVLEPFVDGDHNYFGPTGKEDPAPL